MECGLVIIMVSGSRAAISPATLSYAFIVSSICASLPLPTSGTIIGGCGTMNPAIILIAVTCLY